MYTVYADTPPLLTSPPVTGGDKRGGEIYLQFSGDY